MFRELLAQNERTTVLLCRDEEEEQDVVIKHFHHDPSGAFMHETSVNLELEHPHLLSSTETIYLSGGTGCSVYPYLSGGTLRDRLDREGPMPVSECMQCMHDILVALEYLHGRGYVHSDLKPENVYVTQGLERRHYVLGDLGSTVRCSAETPGAGTPAYAAPETLMRRNDARSDLYSLGIIAYELFVGRLPFEGSIREIQRAHLRGDLHLELIYNSLYRGLVGALTTRDVEQRIGSAGAARRLIERMPLVAPSGEREPCGALATQEAGPEEDRYELRLDAPPEGVAIFERWPNRTAVIEHAHFLTVIRLGERCSSWVFPKSHRLRTPRDGGVVFRCADQLMRLDPQTLDLESLRTLPTGAESFDFDTFGLVWSDGRAFHMLRPGRQMEQQTVLAADDRPRMARVCSLTADGGFAATEGALNESVAFFDKNLVRHAAVTLPATVLELLAADDRLYAVTLASDGGDDSYALWQVHPQEGYTLLATPAPIVDWSCTNALTLRLVDGTLMGAIGPVIEIVGRVCEQDIRAVTHFERSTVALAAIRGDRYILSIRHAQSEEAVA